jgi:hypothetical protein
LIRAGRRPIGPRCRGRSARPDRWPSALLCLGQSLIISRVDIGERRLDSDPQFRRPAPACDTPCALLTATACCQSQGGNGEPDIVRLAPGHRPKEMRTSPFRPHPGPCIRPGPLRGSSRRSGGARPQRRHHPSESLGAEAGRRDGQGDPERRVTDDALDLQRYPRRRSGSRNRTMSAHAPARPRRTTLVGPNIDPRGPPDKPSPRLLPYGGPLSAKTRRPGPGRPPSRGPRGWRTTW